MSESIYDKLSKERKRLQKEGLVPEWFTTGGYSMFTQKYEYDTNGRSVRGQFERIAKAAANHLKGTKFEAEAEGKFFDLMWNNWLSLSTPVMSNMGTDRALPVSCSGGVVDDSINGFYKNRYETAILTKHGFGTSAYLGAIRPRGTPYGKDKKGTASGIWPVFKGHAQDMIDVAQGSCYHPETELLTNLGWMSFAEAKRIGAKPYQVSTDGDVSIAPVVEWVENEFSGNLIHFFDSKNINLLVTPNHRMYIRRQRRVSNERINGKHACHNKSVDQVFTVIPAEDLKLHRDVYFNHSANGNDTEHLSFMDRLIIAHQADGRVIRQKTHFHLKKQRKIDRICWLLDGAGVEYTVSVRKDGTTLVNAAINLGEKNLWRVGVSGGQRGIEILSEVANWDGSLRGSQDKGLSFSYSTIVSKNADYVQAVASMSGCKSRLTRTERPEPRKPIYNVFISQGEKFCADHVRRAEVPYEGVVVCAVVPAGGLIVRANGHTLVCGNTRRGAWAGYLEIDHNDFDEVYDHIYNDPDGMNVGWIITDAFLKRLQSGDSDAIRRYQRCLKMKMVVGRGYFWFVDKANRKLPEPYKRAGMKNHASNLCSEVMLPADNEHQFTCVLSSMLVHHFDEWKDTDAVYWATIFLDCVAEEFIQRAKDIEGLEKTVRFTQKARALGLGQAGLHTYLQDHMIPFESLEARMVSQQIAKHIWEESLRASQDMAKELGEPEWCRGFGVRNASRIAIAPTKSSAIMFGGVSEGINPDPAMVFTQKSAGGSIDRIVPSLLKIMKERGVYNKKTIKSITERFGSVQHVDWLSDDEKAVFKTAFEINQKTVVALASARGRYIDQWQSLNLFFAAEERPEWISEVHQQAFEDPNILGLYYIYTQAGIGAAKETECVACQ